MGDRVLATEQLTSHSRLLPPVDEALESAGAQSILVATDLSNDFEQPIRRAASLAEQHGSQLTVLHVVDRQLPAHTAAQLEAGAREELRTRLGSLPMLDAGPAQVVVATGGIAETILDEAARRDCGLIVVGAHHMAAAGHLHCCTMERVIQATHLPVLTVQTAPTARYQNVLAAVDFSQASRQALHSALRLASTAHFRCIHAYSLPLSLWVRRKHREDLRRKASANFTRMLQQELASDFARLCIGPSAISCLFKEGHPLDVIDEEVGASKPDLLVLGVHDTKAVPGAPLGSVSSAFLNFPPCDVLFRRGPLSAGGQPMCYNRTSATGSVRPTPAAHCP